MKLEDESYRGRFDDINSSFSLHLKRGHDLIEELLTELDLTKTKLKQTTLDLDSESEARRRLQQDVKRCNEKHEKRAFIVVLIDADADGYVFHDDFLARGAQGGEDAADVLIDALRQYISEVAEGFDSLDIVVRAFANLGGLGVALQRDGRIGNVDQLRAFASGFSSRQPLFDFVDVGPGKEKADAKIRDSFNFFLDSFQCKHIMLACGHDAGYAPFLGKFLGNAEVADRITLLEGSPPPSAIRKLNLKSKRFPSVFHTVQHTTSPPPPPTSAAKPPAWHHQPFRQGHVSKFGPILKGDDGVRVDKPITVNPATVERMRSLKLCYFLFMRGQCSLGADCKRNHAFRPLTDEEFYALWSLARMGRCFQNRKANGQPEKDCADEACVYGHWSEDQKGLAKVKG